jgi:type IV secretion system protein VirB9
MNRTRKYSLALWLLAAGVAGANDELSQPVMPLPEGAVVPNVPPELNPPPEPVVPAKAPASITAPVELGTSDAGVYSSNGQSPGELSQASGDSAQQPANSGQPALPNPNAKPRTDSATLSPTNVGEPAKRAVVESQRTAENPTAMPMRDAAGRVVFPFGQSVPTVICAPLRICDIELEKGETVRGAPHIGDSVRWKVAPAVSGSGDRQLTHLIVKPTEAGLDTNLIVPTDRRTYHIRLVSSAERYVSSVAFNYPEDSESDWQNLTRTGSRAGEAPEMPAVSVDRLNFNYQIKVVSGKPAFRPIRVMDDGYHTYIAMNEDMPQRDAPALIGISPAGEEQMINYRLKGNLYIVDGTIHKLALISGAGRRQQRVELTRDPCRHRGWLNICWDSRE